MAVEFVTGRVKSGGLGERLMALFSNEHPDGSLLRGAAFAFFIRVMSAGLAFVSQAVLARWIGSHEYGLFAYVYVWVIVLGTLSPLGMNSSILRFIPEYKEHGEHGKLRGFMLAGGLVSFGSGTLLAIAGVAGLVLFGDQISQSYLVPFYLAFILLPMFSFTEYQEGVGRAWSWIDLALIPPYIIRPVLLLAIMAIAVGLGAEADVKTAFIAAILAAWLVVGTQYLLLSKRLKTEIKREPRQFRFGLWFKVSMPLLLVEGFSLLLMNTDIMMMSIYLTPEDVGHYYAAVKTTGLIGFVYYAVVAVTAQRISALNASGDRQALQTLVQRSAHWTFWPSLAGAAGILSIGWPLLWMFGDDFTRVWPVMFILAGGLLVRAAVGPLDFVLNMMGQQNLCAGILGAGALVNIILNAIFIKHFGLFGAASATALSLALISVMLLVAVEKKLGFQILPWQNRVASKRAEEAVNPLRVEEVDLARDYAQLAAPLEALSRRVLSGNPVYGPDMLAAGLAHLDRETESLRALCLWDEQKGKKVLAGFFPYQERKALPLVGPRVRSAWHHLYGFCTLPLIDREHEADAINAWLGWAAAAPGLVRLPMAVEGRFTDRLEAACAANSQVFSSLALYERAAMRPEPGKPGYFTRVLSGQRRKTLARQWRRLEAQGCVAFDELAVTDDLSAWVEAFLKLEVAGWKGRAGTAMSCDGAAERFFRQAMQSAFAGGRLRFYRLTLDGQPIAMTMGFAHEGELFFFKMAYDEALKQNSPGMLLFAEITKRLDGDAQVRLADSCASPAHPLLNHMWTERRQVSDILIGGRRNSDRMFFYAGFIAIMFRTRTRAMLKRVYHKLRPARAR